MQNSLGREIPEFIEGYGKTEPFSGAWTKLKKGEMSEITIPPPNKAKLAHQTKLTPNLEEAIAKTNPHDGMTVSFHHHLRNGDGLLVKTLDILAKMGIKNITLASSSLADCHTPILKYIADGTICKVWTSGMRGEIGKAVSEGAMQLPVIFHSHGGRVRAIHTGEISIDLAIVATSAADEEGNGTGTFGKSAFGSMGYSIIDMRYAKQVIVVTDNLVEYPCYPLSVTQNFVDYVVVVDSIGDPTKIASGTTRITKSPIDLLIAKHAADVIEHSGYFVPGFSFQLGAGGASLAVAKFMRDKMKRQEIHGSFLLGGVTSYCIDMLNEGLFKSVFDVQSFDAMVSSSLYNNKNHIEISAALYANPYNCGCMTNKLDIVVLGALEVDVDFNVNVLTGSGGYIRGASGGHCDTASGAKLTVVVCPSIRGRISTINQRVQTVVTPGESVDVVVTERGICVNPAQPELEQNLLKAGLNVKKIEDLQQEVENIVGKSKPVEYTDKIVGVVEYRDGTIIDVVREIKH
ncbi:MAG: citrate lyase subunit alpha [Porphyromonadaceae bacterium CG2_30_38_12]|nr:MAG: citrate lyase subunit alpha [Porphyromonadaceae bacterium CG2_30_38_12]